MINIKFLLIGWLIGVSFSLFRISFDYLDGLLAIHGYSVFIIAIALIIDEVG